MENLLPKPAPRKGSSASAAGKKKAAATPKKKGWVVRYLVLGRSGASARDAAPSRLIKALMAGLPVEELEDLRSSLDLSMEKLVPMLGISKATLHRRKTAGRLDPAQSDRVLRYARLTGKAVDVLESLVSARKWLGSPQVGLGGAIPLDYAETEIGSREVEDLLGRIEYGVYS
ncbi:MAG: DUF2384 domain-containing protein [Armatimonadetes bacterium]|nr:DUF2384 domain-containing protein [Akkermansiaceae bacterium]